MKVLRFFLLLLLVSCSGEDNELPEENPETPEAANLEYPFSNSRCTEGENSTGDKTEIEFQWKPGKFNTSFELVVEDLLTNSRSNYSTNDNFYPVVLDKGTPYAWWVISYNADNPEGTKSREWKFYTTGNGITNYAPFAADLLKPENGAELPANTEKVRLEWEAADVDGEDLRFELFIAKDRDFSEAIHRDLPGRFYEIQLEKQVTYFWKVVAKDPAGNTSESNISNFSVLKKEGEGDTAGKSSERKILSFTIDHEGVTYEGDIDHEAQTIHLELDNFDYRALAPTIESSAAAQVVPGSGKSQNFLDDLYYKVTAEDGTERTYDIIVLSGQHDILDFEVHHNGNRYIGIVDAENATVTIELGGEDFGAMETYIKTSNRSTIDPPGGAIQNFNRDVFYTVTSEKGTQKAFKVVAPIKLKQTFPFYGGGGYEFSQETREERFVMYAGADLNFTAVNFPDPQKVAIELISSTGTAYPLQITGHSYYHEIHLEVSNTSHHFNTVIPYSVPSGTYTYRIYDDIKETSYPHKIEVINDHTTIRITGLNGDKFDQGDTLIATGENLPITFYIFSDFSYYRFGEYNNNIRLSEDRTEMRLEIDQNTFGHLQGGNSLKPLVFYTYLEGYEHALLSNTVYFTLEGWN